MPDSRSSRPRWLTWHSAVLSAALHAVLVVALVVLGAGSSEGRRGDAVRLAFYDAPPPRRAERDRPKPDDTAGGGAPATAAPRRPASPRTPRQARVPEPLLPDVPEEAPSDVGRNPYDEPLPPVPRYGGGEGGRGLGGTGTGTGTGSGEGTGPAREAPPVHLGPQMARPRLISGAPPAYPEAARRRGVEADVVVRIEVGIDGRVRDVRVLRGHPLLDDEVVRAVRRWRFSPALRRGNPVAVYLIQRVEFDLRR